MPLFGLSVSSGRGRSWIAGPAGISRLGPNSEPRGNNRSFPETRERARAPVKKIGSRDSIFGLVNSTYFIKITNHNQHAFNIKYLANLIKKYWTCFLCQKLADFLHSGLQQSARPYIRVSVGDEKWSDSVTGKVINGHNAAVFVYFLHQNAITTHETCTQARI